MKKIGIIGTRRRDTAEAFSKIIAKFFEIYEPGDWIVSGGCQKGGDRFAEKLARELLEEFAKISGDEVHPLTKKFLDKFKGVFGA